jgi:PPOX class probable F420-dependent enzyme
MLRADLVRLLRGYRLAVVSTVGPDGAPQSAVVGCAISDDLEIVFDALDSTRKVRNLRANSRVSLVIGWDEEKTAQLEGVADVPDGAERDRVQSCYFEAYPDGRDRLSWPGLVHVCVGVQWARWSDFTLQQPIVFEGDVTRLR